MECVILEKRHCTPLVPLKESQHASTWGELQLGLVAGGDGVPVEDGVGTAEVEMARARRVRME